MILKTANHQHIFKHPELVIIKLIDNINYRGTAGDKAFLMRSCKCGTKQAFEFGPTTKMKDLLATLDSEK